MVSKPLLKNMLSFICTLVIVISMFPMNAFAMNNDDKTETLQNKVVKIGWYQSDLFQEGTSDDTAKSGYSYEYIHKVADYNGWTYEYVYGDWTELLAKLENGEIDVMAGVSKTDERLDKLLYPDEVMGYEHYVLYQHQGGTMDSTDGSTFKNKKIGAIKDNLMTDYLVSWIKEKNVDAEVVYYDSFSERDNDFASGKIDALVTTNNGVLVSSGYSQVTEVGKESYYLAVAKNRTDLLDDLNHALEYMEDIEPYFMTTLEYENYGVTMANSSLSSVEEEWLNTHSSLVIGYMDNYLPYCDLDSNGNVQGLVTDVIDEIKAKLNISERFTTEYRVYQSSSDMLAALENGEVDIAFPVSGTTWNLDKSNVSVTNDVVSADENLVYSGTYSDETTRTIAVAKGNGISHAYVATNFPDSEIVEYDTIDDCVKAVSNGEVGATLLNGLRTDIVTQNRKYASLSLKRLDEPNTICFGIVNDNTGLHMLMNRGLRLIGSDYGNNAAYDYMSSLYETTMTDFLIEHFWLIVGPFLLLVIFAVVLLLRDLRRSKSFLRREEDKNEQLQQSQEELKKAVSLQREQIEKITALNEQIETEQQAKEQEHRIVEALSASFLNVYTVNVDTQLVEILKLNGYVTDGMDAAKKGPYPYEATCHTYISNRVYAEDQQMVTEKMSLPHIVQELTDKDEYEFTYRVDDEGDIRYYQGKYVVAGEGYFVCGFQDIDEIVMEEKLKNEELAAAKKEAEDANAAKTSFLFNMSHDIRTPMNAIMGFRDLLEKHQEDPEKRADYLKKIEDSSNVLLSIINNVLEMARIEKGTVKVEETAWSAEQFNDTLYSVFREMMAQKNLAFTRQIEVKHQYVYCDPAKLREIFLNILSNAYKYTNPGGSVNMHLEEIESDREGWAMYQTTITDTGIGMDEEYLPHIFEEFSREKSTTEAKIEGTGLGMPIVKRLVDILNGTIEVSSKKGEGTTFIITLPHRIADRTDLVEHVGVEIDRPPECW